MFQTVLTICAVSADSLFAGFGVALGRNQKILFPSVVAVVTFCLCCIACAIGSLLKNVQNVEIIGAVILAVMGLSNIVKKPDGKTSAQTFGEYVGVGIAVGTDAATACVPLMLSTSLGVWLPPIMAMTHFVTVYVGTKLANICKNFNQRVTNVISGAVLLCLAVLKII